MQNSSLISERAKALKASLTLEISAKAKLLIQEGRDICSLSAGEPDFNTPDFIIEASIKALKDGITRYGPAAGDPELREAIAFKQTQVNKIPTGIENVMVTNGGKQAIFNLFQVILNPGDEVLLPSPYWLSYPEIVNLAGAKPIIVKGNSEDSFKLNIEKLESKVTSKTRLLILNSPNNPTGLVMSSKELNDIADFLRRHPKLLIMSDEIYEMLLSKGQNHYSFGAIAPDLIDRVFTVNGFAKGWAMTGWRIGYLSGNPDVIKQAIALQSQSTSNVCSFAQRGALAALQGSRDCVEKMVKSYNIRRELISNGLNQIEGVSLINPQGAFYAFPKISKGNINSINFCKLALDKVGLALVPGIAFGEDQCVRVSCAVSSEKIIDGLKRLGNLMELIKETSN